MTQAGYTRCERCGDIVCADGAVRVHTDRYRSCMQELWCRDCVDNSASQCEDCGEWYADYEISVYDVHGIGDRTLCEDCLSDHYYTCTDCGCVIVDEEAYVDDWGDTYCPDCHKAQSGKLKAYGPTYAEDFFDSGSDDYCAEIGLYLGVELETEATRDRDPEDLADALCDAIGEDRIECKEDSSLSYGCEIATQPMSPAYHLGDDSIWPDVVRVCQQHGATSHDGGRCGMHIHISRAGLAHNRDYSAAWVIDRIMRLYPEEWRRFSRRASLDQWCKIEPVQRDTETPAADLYADWGQEYHGRYRAINLTNRSTIEWRLNRGSLRLGTIRAAIEMAAGLALAANRMVTAYETPDTLTWDDVISRVADALRAHDLPTDDLTDYLERRGLAPVAVTA